MAGIAELDEPCLGVRDHLSPIADSLRIFAPRLGDAETATLGNAPDLVLSHLALELVFPSHKYLRE